MSRSPVKLSVFPAILLGLFMSLGWSAHAAPQFHASEITGTNTDLMICDLDGDGLKDLVLLNQLSLAIFYQDPKTGFPHEPQQTLQLESRPSLVWTAKLGQPAESLLVMTSEGVTEFFFTNRTTPPARRQIIRQPTAVPDSAATTNALYLPLSVQTGGDWPLILVPVADGVQVWQHGDEWHQVQFIGQSIDASLRPSVLDPGYSTSLELALNVGDVNGDHREDLMIRTGNRHDTNTYRLYLQQTNGLFRLQPSLVYADKVEPFAMLSWMDLNRDGKVDLVKSVWPNEPSFIPGVPAAKVFVNLFLADARGQIPAEPQHVFRKNDWIVDVPVLDLDDDGYPDLVLGYNHLESREAVSKEITSKRLDYNLRFFFNRPGTGFPAAADCQFDLVIHLDHAEAIFDWSLPDNFARYVRFGGDFTGDGKVALLVREHSDDISAYSFVSRAQGFSAKPTVRFNCPEPIDEWQVVDLNHDGVSDLIVKLAGEHDFRIFISQK